ncbi:hypothetical protein GLOIN_2v1766278 [Rhizophagus irregularis DAOM 181602=DAOM 197198]|nr:hypothetical protein GLOIN_2v1766278 [Rhizophagus irregularis DAOM 181602=DAOM 197198]
MDKQWAIYCYSTCLRITPCSFTLEQKKLRCEFVAVLSQLLPNTKDVYLAPLRFRQATLIAIDIVPVLNPKNVLILDNVIVQPVLLVGTIIIPIIFLCPILLTPIILPSLHNDLDLMSVKAKTVQFPFPLSNAIVPLLPTHLVINLPWWILIVPKFKRSFRPISGPVLPPPTVPVFHFTISSSPIPKTADEATINKERAEIYSF